MIRQCGSMTPRTARQFRYNELSFPESRIAALGCPRKAGREQISCTLSPKQLFSLLLVSRLPCRSRHKAHWVKSSNQNQARALPPKLEPTRWAVKLHMEPSSDFWKRRKQA